ncbi:MAG TPA: thioredoxin [Deltaproteobacteria bacterium]|jgi:putative thioredoxin|nr:thioredoxin [Deltaproteobacteria bacterium]
MMEVRDTDFEREVLERSHSIPVLVDFWAPWCRPCEVVGPVLENLADEFEGRFLLATVDIDQNPRASANYAVRSIPLVLALRDGEVLAQLVGVQSEGVYRQLVENLLRSDDGASV